MKIHISGTPEEENGIGILTAIMWYLLPSARTHAKTDDATGRLHVYLTTTPDIPENSS